MIVIGRLAVAAMLLGLALPPATAEPQPSAAPLLAALEPAVVNLSITRHTRTDSAADLAAQRGVTVEKVQGSGFVIDPGGTIVTNPHVLANATDVIVTLNDSTRLRGAVLAIATHSDIALLKVRAGKKLTAVHLGNSSALRPGDPVLVAGNPLGVGSSFSAGIVSALDRVTRESEFGSFLQVDAPINQGNSGGPVLNMSGDVVGITTALFAPGNENGSVGLGLAIPSDDARLVITRLEESGHDTLGTIGIRVQRVTEDIAAAAELPRSTASIITHVNANGSAAKAGLQSGDIVLTVASEEAGSPQQLNRALAASPVGKTVQLGIWRDGKRLLIPVVIDELPADENEKIAAPTAEKVAAKAGDEIGLALGLLTSAVRARLAMSPDETGVLVEDVRADQRGLGPRYRRRVGAAQSGSAVG